MPILTSVEGVYRDGKIELNERPADVKEARVIVTFLPTVHPDLAHLTPEEIEELEWRLQPFAADWNAPGMEVYDEM
jgi:hypothetical protein